MNELEVDEVTLRMVDAMAIVRPRLSWPEAVVVSAGSSSAILPSDRRMTGAGKGAGGRLVRKDTVCLKNLPDVKLGWRRAP